MAIFTYTYETNSQHLCTIAAPEMNIYANMSYTGAQVHVPLAV